MSNWAIFLSKARWSLIDALAKLLERLARGEVVIVERISGAEVANGDELMVLGTGEHHEGTLLDGRSHSRVHLVDGVYRNSIGPWNTTNNAVWTWGKPSGRPGSSKRVLRRVIWRNVLGHPR